MAFINWDFSNTIPTYFTYIIHPTITPITINPPIEAKIPTPSIKLEPEETSENFIIKEETNQKDEELETKTWCEGSIKQEPENFDEAIKEETEITESELKSTSKLNYDKSKNRKRGTSYSCEFCSYKTSWKGNLTKHVVSRHTDSEKINWLQCNHCSYRGKTKDYLKCHLLHVHNISVKWFDCPHCTFKAKLKSHLDRHVIVNHTDSEKIQWFECEHCSYKAKLKSNLKQHILSKHTDSTKIRWFQCDYCNFKAKRKRNLKFHQLNRHTDDDKIQWVECEFCPLKFKRKPAMKVHVANVHGKEEKIKKMKIQTREIPVFIENRLCWKRIVVDRSEEDCSFKCSQCSFRTYDKDEFKKHVMKEHIVTELQEEDDYIVKKSYKTKDVIVIVDDVPCVKKVVEHSLSTN